MKPTGLVLYFCATRRYQEPSAFFGTIWSQFYLLKSHPVLNFKLETILTYCRYILKAFCPKVDIPLWVHTVCFFFFHPETIWYECKQSCLNIYFWTIGKYPKWYVPFWNHLVLYILWAWRFRCTIGYSDFAIFF